MLTDICNRKWTIFLWHSSRLNAFLLMPPDEQIRVALSDRVSTAGIQRCDMHSRRLFHDMNQTSRWFDVECVFAITPSIKALGRADKTVPFSGAMRPCTRNFLFLPIIIMNLVVVLDYTFPPFLHSFQQRAFSFPDASRNNRRRRIPWSSSDSSDSTERRLPQGYCRRPQAKTPRFGFYRVQFRPGVLRIG